MGDTFDIFQHNWNRFHLMIMFFYKLFHLTENFFPSVSIINTMGILFPFWGKGDLLYFVSRTKDFKNSTHTKEKNYKKREISVGMCPTTVVGSTLHRNLVRKAIIYGSRTFPFDSPLDSKMFDTHEFHVTQNE